MKKLLALTSAIILSISCFAGCGKKNNSKNKGDKSSSDSIDITSQLRLNEAASSLKKAFDASLDEADEYGWLEGSSGYISSNGSHTYESYDNDSIMSTVADYYKDVDNYSYVAFIKDDSIDAIYIADSMDSEIVGTYPNGIESGEKLENIVKNGISPKDAVIMNSAEAQFALKTWNLLDSQSVEIDFGGNNYAAYTNVSEYGDSDCEVNKLIESDASSEYVKWLVVACNYSDGQKEQWIKNNPDAIEKRNGNPPNFWGCVEVPYNDNITIRAGGTGISLEKRSFDYELEKQSASFTTQ